MPWTVANPPPPAKNWTDDEKAKCVTAANATLTDSGDEQQAIFACIKAAGKSEQEQDMTTPAPESIWIEATITSAKPSKGKVFEGKAWDVTIIGAKSAEDVITIDNRSFVRSKNDRLYDTRALRESAPMWDGVIVYDNHQTQEEYERTRGMRSVAKEWIGSLVKPVWKETEKQLRATLKIVEAGVAAKLKAAWDAGILNSIGLSIDTIPIIGQEAIIEGAPMPVIEGFQKILSLDLVAKPAAGGGFNRILASQQETEQENTAMTAEEIRKLVETAVAEALAAQQKTEAEEVPPEEETPPEAEARPEPGKSEDDPPEPEEAATEAVLTKAEFEAYQKRQETQALLRERLAESKLPQQLKQVIKDNFENRIFEANELERFMKQLQEAWTSADPTGRVTEAGNGKVTGGMNEDDKREIAFLRLVMGSSELDLLGKREEDFVKERIPESYHSWVKSGRERTQYRRISEWAYDILGGDYFTDPRAMEAVTTSSMTSIIKNALNLMLANDYARRQRWWEPIVRTEEVDTIDQATLIRVYGLTTLSVVDEGQPYTELTWADEEETAAFVKKGNYVGVTMETLLRDKVSAIRTLPQRLATSWYNTLSALNAGVFTVNSNTGPALADTGALFNATAVTTAGGHANLLTTAFGTNTTAYAAARLAMRKQTDQPLGAGQRLGIIPRFVLVPYDLEVAAQTVMNSERVPGSSNNDINPYFRESQVIGVPEWTDTNDWALVADPNEFPAIWNIFLRGNRVPQLFTADNETAGAMFTNDTIRYKVRMLTYRFSSTYDCSPVSDFRPLHKSNVT